MRINQVSYRELQSGPGFTHQAIEMQATVDEDEPVAGVLDMLQDRVRAELGLYFDNPPTAPPPDTLAHEPDPLTQEEAAREANRTETIRAERHRIAFQIRQIMLCPAMDLIAKLQAFADDLESGVIPF